MSITSYNGKVHLRRSVKKSVLGMYANSQDLVQHAKPHNHIKALTPLVAGLSLSIGGENGPERGLKTVSFNP